MSQPFAEVEVVYAPPQGGVWCRRLPWRAGMTLAQALTASGLEQAFPGLDWQAQGAGVFGRALPLNTLLQPGDRVEVYRSLSLDPKAARAQRARARPLR